MRELVVLARSDAAVRGLTDALVQRSDVVVRVVDGYPLWKLTARLDTSSRRRLPRVASVWALRRAAAIAWAQTWELRARFLDRDAYLVCSSPDQAPATRWFRRKAVYYVIDDFTVGHDYWPPELVQRWEERLVARCEHVIAVSRSLASKLERRLALPAGSVHVSPNALPAHEIPDELPAHPAPLPSCAGQLARPVVGVLGTISSRLRLGWLRSAVDALPELHWLFAGWIEEAEMVAEDADDLAWLRGHPRCHFTGRLTYAELVRCAAAIDVAVLAYSDRSVNPCGSSMRFFMSLAFGHPILATPGCAQLEEFPDLVHMCRDPEALLANLRQLLLVSFDDGGRRHRWEQARVNTWEQRAANLVRILGTPTRR